MRRALLCLAACGRIGFQATPVSRIDASNVPAPASCAPLAPSCGETATDDCCASPLVPGGTFYRSYDVATDGMFGNMSSPATVGDFRLDKYEVTVARFRVFVDAGFGTQANPPAAGTGAHPDIAGSGWNATWNAELVADTPTLRNSIQGMTWTDAPGPNDTLPMDFVSWYEAFAFCIFDGGFLPTEAEWNYAAAGGAEQRAYPWSQPPSSTTIDATDGAWGGTIGDLASMTAVGGKPAGDGKWGQSDLGGNVSEITLDSSIAYGTPCDNCLTLPGTNESIRGGGYYGTAAEMRAARRGSISVAMRFSDVGIRCARAP